MKPNWQEIEAELVAVRKARSAGLPRTVSRGAWLDLAMHQLGMARYWRRQGNAKMTAASLRWAATYRRAMARTPR